MWPGMPPSSSLQEGGPHIELGSARRTVLCSGEENLSKYKEGQNNPSEALFFKPPAWKCWILAA
eukprot:scaffold37918_cov17-Tisochrysis_lutea.AAC.4